MSYNVPVFAHLPGLALSSVLTAESAEGSRRGRGDLQGVILLP